jgi:hypothetical protein
MLRVRELMRGRSNVAVDMSRSFSECCEFKLVVGTVMRRFPANSVNETWCSARLFVVAGQGEESVFEFGALHIHRVHRRIESEQFRAASTRPGW